MKNTIRKNSPADKAGLVIGSWYPLSHNTNCLKKGDLVQFTEDDGSTLPRFEAVGLDGSDNYAFLYITDLDLTEDTKVKVKRIGDIVSVKLLANLPKRKYNLLSIPYSQTKETT